MYIGVISGYFIAKIIKKLGRRIGINIHMLSYLTLVFGMIHATLIGGLAKTYFLIPIIMFISIISIDWLKYDIKVQLRRKKLECSLKRREITKKPHPVKGEKKTRPIYTSSKRTAAITGVTCPTCSTLNDDVAFFCKRVQLH